jgi:hypothetical protein
MDVIDEAAREGQTVSVEAAGWALVGDCADTDRSTVGLLAATLFADAVAAAFLALRASSFSWSPPNLIWWLPQKELMSSLPVSRLKF